jgi:hypothetical protein
MRKRALIALSAIAVFGATALNTGSAVARQGADDPVGHVRHGHGADDPRAHKARHGRGADDKAADDKRARAARHGADDPAGDDRGGRGNDD